MEVNSHVEVILVYELLIFYFTIFGLMSFLLISRFFSFRTIRERFDLGGNMRYRRDFLEFVQDDVHYSLIAITELALFIYVTTHLANDIDTRTIASMIVISIHIFFQAMLNFLVFYRPKSIKIKSKVWKIIATIYFIFTAMVIIFIAIVLNAEVGQRRYWYPYLCVYLQLKIFTVLSIAYEKGRFEKRLEVWKRQYIVMRALNQVELQELVNE